MLGIGWIQQQARAGVVFSGPFLSAVVLPQSAPIARSRVRAGRSAQRKPADGVGRRECQHLVQGWQLTLRRPGPSTCRASGTGSVRPSNSPSSEASCCNVSNACTSACGSTGGAWRRSARLRCHKRPPNAFRYSEAWSPSAARSVPKCTPVSDVGRDLRLRHVCRSFRDQIHC